MEDYIIKDFAETYPNMGDYWKTYWKNKFLHDSSESVSDWLLFCYEELRSDGEAEKATFFKVLHSICCGHKDLRMTTLETIRKWLSSHPALQL